ncbi:hypothetical protein SAMN06264364_13424 [Quadrisphaera granulorum]|uniref:Uncharacterized protein n=1 Tax=Quadrisphaera granulorum TaxID=317664 RepID=A0A315ZQJ3_9ACTN|nr:hypothetical protein BXY45_13424 [Quadrisphaera granulorum]SZE98618.1 hypothetical protein SAMN06264364_13424 [Quadrisphaera granulorum]
MVRPIVTFATTAGHLAMVWRRETATTLAP